MTVKNDAQKELYMMKIWTQSSDVESSLYTADRFLLSHGASAAVKLVSFSYI